MAAKYIDLEVPVRLKPEQIAQNFAAQFLGHRAFDGATRSLPILLSEGYWQLDGGNDFWLSVKGGQVRISCRYEDEIPVLEAMATLFRWKYARVAA